MLSIREEINQPWHTKLNMDNVKKNFRVLIQIEKYRNTTKKYFIMECFFYINSPWDESACMADIVAATEII